MADYDNNGFVRDGIIPFIRQGVSAERDVKLGPIDKVMHERLRKQFMDVADVVAENAPYPEADLIAKRMMDMIFITTDKPTIAWTPDDILNGLMLSSSDRHLAPEDGLMLADIAMLTIRELTHRKMVQPVLVADAVSDWLHDVLPQAITEANALINDDQETTEDMLDRILEMQEGGEVLPDEAIDGDDSAWAPLYEFQNLFSVSLQLQIQSPLARAYFYYLVEEYAHIRNAEDGRFNFARFLNGLRFQERLVAPLFGNSTFKALHFLDMALNDEPVDEIVADQKSALRVINENFVEPVLEPIDKGHMMLDVAFTKTTNVMGLVTAAQSNNVNPYPAVTSKPLKTDAAKVRQQYNELIGQFMADLPKWVSLADVQLQVTRRILDIFAKAAAEKWHRNIKSMTANVMLDILVREYETTLKAPEKYLMVKVLDSFLGWLLDHEKLSEADANKLYRSLLYYIDGFYLNQIMVDADVNDFGAPL
jgi:hypothetical protein